MDIKILPNDSLPCFQLDPFCFCRNSSASPLSKFNTNFTDSSPGSTAPPPLLSTNQTGLFFLKHPEPCRPTTTLLAEALGFPSLFLTFNQCLILQEDGMQFKHSFKRWAV